jgi:uncharacterized protein YjdB
MQLLILHSNLCRKDKNVLSKQIPPDIQENLYVTYNSSNPTHRSISEVSGGVQAIEATTYIVVVAESDGYMKRKRETEN